MNSTRNRRRYAAPSPHMQKAARQDLANLFAHAGNVWIIHYSCESFYDRPKGKSARITSIAVRNLRSAQTLSFSIHQTAERQGVSPAKIEKNYDRLEKQMLREFYAFVKINAPAQFLHWNMRDINYGFQAIAHRFRVLGGKPIEIADDRKFDLARLLIDIYGIDYAPNPRLPSIMEINSIGRLAFMTGEEEARAFENRNYVGLHQSTLRKVDVMHGIADRVHTRKLLTNTSWWQMHGGRFIDVINWIIEHKGISFLIAAVGLGAAIFTLFRG